MKRNGNGTGRKVTAVLLAAALCVGSIRFGNAALFSQTTEAAQQHIAVDINGDQHRNNLKSKSFQDWTIDTPCQSVQFMSGEVTFTLSNESGAGTLIGKQQKTLVNSEQSPLLTCDGVSFNEITTGGILKLEIVGLSEGNHTISTWHSYYNLTPEQKRSTMSVFVNGELAAQNMVIPSRVAQDSLAAIFYTSFEVGEDGKATFLFRADGNNSSYDLPTLNAFELDGTKLGTAIEKPFPEEGETHFETSQGFSWEAAEGALSHRVYLGTQEKTVADANEQSQEYLGETKNCSYTLADQALSHLSRYYWRVDEVFEDGTVVKGNVMWFETAHLAFPGAEGYGRYAKGGRGGRVIEVTNLNDSGPGSLRQAIEEEKGARIIVFRVGGVIELQSRLSIPSDGGNVYVAGQTAPGDGITLTKYPFGIYYAQDVVIRHVRLRVGDSNQTSSDGMGMAGANASIIDHCSISWTTDEGTSSRGAENITFQYNLIAEALNNSVHYDASDRDNTERHSFAGSISGNIGSFHHNLLVNCTGRNWSLAGGVENDGKTYGGQLDIRNNVIYNFRDRTTDGGARRVNFVGNYYKKGAVSKNMKIFTIDGDELGTGDMQMAYLSGNKLVDSAGRTILDSNEDAWAKGRASANSKFGASESQVRSNEPFFESYVTTQTADEAYESVLASVGATVPKQDYLDQRYIQETRTGTYTYTGSKDKLKGIIDSQTDVGGYPILSGGIAPADSDHDGMPDEWETEHGLNAFSADDQNGLDLSAEGYTNLEMYLDELAGDPVVYDSTRPSASPVPSASVTPSQIPSQTPSETPSAPPSQTPEASASAKPSQIPSQTPSETPSAPPSQTPEASASATPSQTPSQRPSQTPEASASAPPSQTPSQTPEASASAPPSQTPGQTPTPDPIRRGDLNGDGKVELEEARICLKFALGIEQPETKELFEAADIDGNGEISLTDVQIVLKNALGIREVMLLLRRRILV